MTLRMAMLFEPAHTIRDVLIVGGEGLEVGRHLKMEIEFIILIRSHL